MSLDETTAAQRFAGTPPLLYILSDFTWHTQTLATLVRVNKLFNTIFSDSLCQHYPRKWEAACDDDDNSTADRWHILGCQAPFQVGVMRVLRPSPESSLGAEVSLDRSGLVLNRCFGTRSFPPLLVMSLSIDAEEYGWDESLSRDLALLHLHGLNSLRLATRLDSRASIQGITATLNVAQKLRILKLHHHQPPRLDFLEPDSPPTQSILEKLCHEYGKFPYADPLRLRHLDLALSPSVPPTTENSSEDIQPLFILKLVDLRYLEEVSLNSSEHDLQVLSLLTPESAPHLDTVSLGSISLYPQSKRFFQRWQQLGGRQLRLRLWAGVDDWQYFDVDRAPLSIGPALRPSSILLPEPKKMEQAIVLIQNTGITTLALVYNRNDRAQKPMIGPFWQLVRFGQLRHIRNLALIPDLGTSTFGIPSHDVVEILTKFCHGLRYFFVDGIGFSRDNPEMAFETLREAENKGRKPNFFNSKFRS